VTLPFKYLLKSNKLIWRLDDVNEDDCLTIVYVFVSQTQVDGGSSNEAETSRTGATTDSGVKRLHVSNIPFRFREADLRGLLGVRIIYGELPCSW